MKCLILGATGQVGGALVAAAPGGMEIAAPSHAVCDITDLGQLEAWFEDTSPALVINAAGYTDVNAAESHENQARRVNAQGVEMLATLCRWQEARLVQLSTDFVFDGQARTPYAEDALSHPLSAYGRSKQEGELLAQQGNPDTLIVRTAWVYAAQGRNFVNTMLERMRRQDEIRVVSDQRGTPTHARNLARAVWRLAEDAAPGVYHFTDEGEASWHEFALAIRNQAHAIGLLAGLPEITAVASGDYPSLAARPAYGVLDKSKIHATIGIGQDWRSALSDMLNEKKRDG